MVGRYDEALEAFNTAIGINPSYAQAWYNTGVIFDFMANFEAAIQAYNKATQIDPHYEKAWLNKNRDIDIVGIHVSYP
jgi:tetratricopeptide (TPR) repeat protein